MVSSPARTRERLVILGSIAAVVLVLLGVVFVYIRWRRVQETAEAQMVVSAIRVAEEARRVDRFYYAGCSTSLSVTYPSSGHWPDHASPLADCWDDLAVAYSGDVRFRYSVVAGDPGPVEIPGLQVSGLPTHSDDPWYVVQATADRDGNGVSAVVVGTSWSPDLLVVNSWE